MLSTEALANEISHRYCIYLLSNDSLANLIQATQAKYEIAKEKPANKPLPNEVSKETEYQNPVLNKTPELIANRNKTLILILCIKKSLVYSFGANNPLCLAINSLYL